MSNEQTQAEREFQAGDVVVCVDAWDSFNALTEGAAYRIVGIKYGCVRVFGEGRPDGWDCRRFRLATPEERAEFEAGNQVPQAPVPSPEPAKPVPVAPCPTRAELVRHYAGMIYAADKCLPKNAASAAEALVDELHKRGYAPGCGREDGR